MPWQGYVVDGEQHRPMGLGESRPGPGVARFWQELQQSRVDLVLDLCLLVLFWMVAVVIIIAIVVKSGHG